MKGAVCMGERKVTFNSRAASLHRLLAKKRMYRMHVTDDHAALDGVYSLAVGRTAVTVLRQL